MTARNEHTGDEIKTRTVTDQYRNEYDRIFRKNKDPLPSPEQEEDDPSEAGVAE